MKKFTIFFFVFVLSLSSCNYSEKQHSMIHSIAKKSQNTYNPQFRKNILNEFSKKEIVDLSSSNNPEVALYFYEILIEKFPEECFEILIKNLNNKKTLDIFTSYDTINEMTVPNAMMFYAISKNNIFTNDQKEKLFSIVLNDIEKKSHLEGYLLLYLNEQKSNPNPQYYSNIKKIILKRSSNQFYSNSVLLNYFTNYNKPEDSLIIKKILKTNISEEGMIHMNSTVEYIKDHSKITYFPILDEFYVKKIKGKTFRADDTFFELEDLTKATINYKSEKAKELLKNITFDTKYESNGNSSASNEHIYLLLKDKDRSNYFAEITDNLKRKVDKVKLDTIISWNNRWNHH